MINFIIVISFIVSLFVFIVAVNSADDKGRKMTNASKVSIGIIFLLILQMSLLTIVKEYYLTWELKKQDDGTTRWEVVTVKPWKQTNKN